MIIFDWWVYPLAFVFGAMWMALFMWWSVRRPRTRSTGAYKRALKQVMDEAEREWEAHGRDDVNRILW